MSVEDRLGRLWHRNAEWTQPPAAGNPLDKSCHSNCGWPLGTQDRPGIRGGKNKRGGRGVAYVNAEVVKSHKSPRILLLARAI